MKIGFNHHIFISLLWFSQLSVAADNSGYATKQIDAVARATQIGGGGIYPRFQSDLDKMSDRNKFPRFSNQVSESPVGKPDAIHAFFVRNSGGSVMSRKCTLSGRLAQKADGSFSDRLVLDFWKDGKPLIANTPVVVDAKRYALFNDHIQARDGDDKEKPLNYTFAVVNKDLKKGTATYELRYHIPSKQQIDLSLACYSEHQGELMPVRFSCTGDDITGAIDTYFKDEFFCNIGKSGGTKPNPNKEYPVSGKINANRSVALDITINEQSQRVNNQSIDRRYLLGKFTNGSYLIQITKQPKKVSCIFANTKNQTTTIIINGAAVVLPDIYCNKPIVDPDPNPDPDPDPKPAPKGVIIKEGFETPNN